MDFKKILIPALIGFILYLINSNFLKTMFNLFPITLTLTRGAWWIYAPWYMKIIYVGIFAPIFEELVFRNIIFKWFLKRNYFLIGLMFSSVLFGFWHITSGWGILKVANMTLVGIVFALVYKKYGLKGSLICHFANNWLALVFILGI